MPRMVFIYIQQQLFAAPAFFGYTKTKLYLMYCTIMSIRELLLRLVSELKNKSDVTAKFNIPVGTQSTEYKAPSQQCADRTRASSEN